MYGHIVVNLKQALRNAALARKEGQHFYRGMWMPRLRKSYRNPWWVAIRL